MKQAQQGLEARCGQYLDFDELAVRASLLVDEVEFTEPSGNSGSSVRAFEFLHSCGFIKGPIGGGAGRGNRDSQGFDVGRILPHGNHESKHLGWVGHRSLGTVRVSVGRREQRWSGGAGRGVANR